MSKIDIIPQGATPVNSLVKIKKMFSVTHERWLLEYGQTENGMTYCTICSPGKEIDDFSPERLVMGLIMSELARMTATLTDRESEDWKNIYLHHMNTMFSKVMDNATKSMVDYVYDEMFEPIKKTIYSLENDKIIGPEKQLEPHKD